MLAGKKQLDLTAALDVGSIALSQRPPSLAELLPPELAKAVAIPQFQNGTAAAEFVTFDATFIRRAGAILAARKWRGLAQSMGTISIAWRSGTSKGWRSWLLTKRRLAAPTALTLSGSGSG